MTYRTICVLGGTGFVGRHLLDRLARPGRRLRVLTRDAEARKDVAVLPGVELVEADVHDPAALLRHLAGCDAAVNLVGILNESRGATFEQVHVELPRKLAAACRETGVRRLLHMSALNADARAGASAYLRSKGAGEDAVHEAADARLHVTSFRPSVIFGPGDSFLNRFVALARLSPLVLPLACPQARFAPVYVGDVAEAFARALEDPHTYGRRYPLCGPREYTLRELVEYALRTAGVRRIVVGLPDWVSRLEAALLEHAPGKPFTRDNYRSLQVPSVCGAENGLSRLGIVPTPLEAVAPLYLGRRTWRERLNRYRRELPLRRLAR